MSFQRLRGMHDIFDHDAELFQTVEYCAHKTFPLFGFSELRTPLLEEKNLFTRALGTETEVVQKEMYEFEDRSGTRVALRPEGTAGVVRAYLENELDKSRGLTKFYYIGPMFRSERPQAGRLRQFHQIGVEQLGVTSPYADAETIHCLVQYLKAIGIDGFKLRINNIGDFEERKIYSAAFHEYLMNRYQDLCNECISRYHRASYFRILDCKNEKCRSIIEKSPRILDYLTTPSLDYYGRVKDALKVLKVDFTQDRHLVRGLDYYTRTVFELSHPSLGSQDALAAGGRYDNLIEMFGGPKLGAVGFAIGVERLLMCIKAKETDAEKIPNSIFIIALGDQAVKLGFETLGKLRNQGLKVSMDLEGRSMKSQMRSADKTRSSYAIILGDNEIQKNICLLKNMTNGSQQEIQIEDMELKCKELFSQNA